MRQQRIAPSVILESFKSKQRSREYGGRKEIDHVHINNIQVLPLFKLINALSSIVIYRFESEI